MRTNSSPLPIMVG